MTSQNFNPSKSTTLLIIIAWRLSTLYSFDRLKTGDATLCRLARRDNRYALHLAVGDAVAPRAWEETGWTPPAPQFPGLEFVLHGDMEEFSQNVMGQHYILSYGDNAGVLREFCKLTGIEVIESGFSWRVR